MGRGDKEKKRDGRKMGKFKDKRIRALETERLRMQRWM
jgi:hypothetical protein